MFLLLSTEINPALEKITFVAALMLAVVWLWREMSALNKKRDADQQLWRDTYEKIIERQILVEKDSIKAIEQNTAVIDRFTEVLDEVKEKLK